MHKTTIALIDYGAGNLRSAAKALEAIAPEATVTITANPADIEKATHIILPGVGAFGDCRRGVANVPGLEDALHQAVRIAGKPFLGICVGMQLLAETGEEHGIHRGFGWLKGSVRPLPDGGGTFKIPHMGWNNLIDLRPHPLLEGIDPGTDFYFVHSYALDDTPVSLAWCTYSRRFPAIVAQDNIAGIQAHPEKSSTAGLKFLRNFLHWRP